MKQPKKFLYAIRSLPEGARRILAFVSFFLTALLVLQGWTFLLSQRLASFSAEESVPPAAEKETVPAANRGAAALSPAEGLTESFRALQLGAVAQNGLSSAASALKIAWRYIYDPLK